MDVIKIRVFGSKDCEKCQSLIKAFDFHAISFDYIDVDLESNDKICDENKVDELPHLQAYYEDTGKVFFTYVGYINPLVFLEDVKEYVRKINHFFNINKEAAVKNVDVEKLKREMNERKNTAQPCGTCGKNKANNVKS